MRKKLLFVIDSLTIGGAEKSLISLLNVIAPSKYEIDLMFFKSGGDLEEYLPKHINLLPIPEYFRFINNEHVPVNKRLIYLFYRYRTSLNLRINSYKLNTLHTEQIVYKNIKKVLRPIPTKYDVAIAYSQGMPTYFVANKITATKKLAWINTDYVNTQYNKNLDYESYGKINNIIAVSQNTKDSVSQIRKEYRNKVDLIKDITEPNLIYKMSKANEVKEFDTSVVNILTVGRLATVKSYDKAVEVARMLRESAVKFKWFVIGEGPERKKIQLLIDKYNLNNEFILLGKKINPYPYMKNCDLYVQTSAKEGFGLTVCEAKILKRPIVCTNFPTAKEIIKHEVDGLIVEHDLDSIYKGIKKYLDEEEFKEKILKKLESIKPYSSVNQLNYFYNLIEK